jgi:hypothetical protein
MHTEHTQTSISLVGFEPTMERAKAVRALECAATVISLHVLEGILKDGIFFNSLLEIRIILDSIS